MSGAAFEGRRLSSLSKYQLMSDLIDNDKKLYYSISEVSQILELKETLLRFWEKEFPQIAPRKGSRGIRRYTKEDIETIRTIRDLVKGRGLKIAAAREVLKQNKQGTANPIEAVQRLRAIREELVAIKQALGDM